MIIALALGAAMLIGVGLVLQQHAAEQEPQALFLRLRLIGDLLHKRRWLAGVGIMAAGEISWAWVLGRISLSVAEPLLATSLLFALVVAVPLTGERLRKSEILGAVLLAGGVAALSVSRTAADSPGTHVGSAAYWPAAAVIGGLALLLVRAGWRRHGQQRATLTGLASGLCFGISDALTRSTLQTVSVHGILAALAGWPAYGLAVSTLVALWLMESAFNAAPLHASLPAITAAEPVVGILLGVLVFGDVIRISPAMVALQAAGVAALVGGVILVARAPVLSSLRRGSRTRTTPLSRPRLEKTRQAGFPGQAAGRASTRQLPRGGEMSHGMPEHDPGVSPEEEGIPDLQEGTPEQQRASDPQQAAVPGDSPAAIDDYGTTAVEQAEGEPLEGRLAREEPEERPALDADEGTVAEDPTAGYPMEEAAVRVEPD